MISKQFFQKDDRFHCIFKSQDQFPPGDIDNRPIDIVFLDASHDLEVNRKTFLRILPCLSDSSLLIIHDTGLWNKEFFTEVHQAFAKSGQVGKWLDSERFAHQPDERFFVEWIIKEFPDFRAIFFHSDTCLRHGLTVLQKRALQS